MECNFTQYCSEGGGFGGGGAQYGEFVFQYGMFRNVHGGAVGGFEVGFYLGGREEGEDSAIGSVVVVVVGFLLVHGCYNIILSSSSSSLVFGFEDYGKSCIAFDSISIASVCVVCWCCVGVGTESSLRNRMR